jgi:hypothetical protein
MFCRRGPAILAAMRPDLSSDSCGRGRLALFATLFWGALLVSLARFGVDGFDASWTWGLMLGAVATGLLFPHRAAVQFGAHVLHLPAFACAAPHYSNFHTAAAFTSLAADGLHHRATFSDSGRLRQLDRLDADPALARPLPWWERRLVNTMAVPYPRLAELGLLPPGETRPPHAADTLAISIP